MAGRGKEYLIIKHIGELLYSSPIANYLGVAMRKSKELQMEILQNYFSIQDNIATLKLVYDTFAELVNPNFGDDKIEKLNDTLFSDIREAVSLLPKKYKLDLQIVIKDFGEYSKEECEKIIIQNVKLSAYQTLKQKSKKLAAGWSLIGIGAITLLLSYIFHDQSLWFDLINISGTLFVWEGVNMAFIEKSFENKAMKTLAKSIHKVSIE